MNIIYEVLVVVGFVLIVTMVGIYSMITNTESLKLTFFASFDNLKSKIQKILNNDYSKKNEI